MSPRDATIEGQKSESAFAREGEGMMSCEVVRRILEPEISTLNPEKNG
jgi:hypothetical protein